MSPKCGTGGPPPKSTFVACDGTHYVRNDDGGIPDEMGDRLHQISNLAGTLSMANTGHPDSGGSQFFINVGGESDRTEPCLFSVGVPRRVILLDSCMLAFIRQ